MQVSKSAAGPGAAALKETPVWLAAPFRPFFLGAGVLGVAVIPLWLGLLLGFLSLPTALPPLQWHVHEMFFGLVGAAAAGFLLTAVTVWTGTGPVRGGILLILFSAWVLARLTLLFGAGLPDWAAWLFDCVFLAATGAVAAHRILSARQWRQLPLVAAFAVLGFAAWRFPETGALNEHAIVLAADAVTVLMIVIGGRITPAFSRNWLRLGGADPGAVKDPAWLQWGSIAGALALIAADALGAPAGWRAAISLSTAAVLGARLVLWRPWRFGAEPLLWILHLGVGWTVLALALRGVSAGFGLAPTVWLHALGAGAMATLILGVMTRVALGHTGRPLHLPRGAIGAYFSITAAALARLSVALGWLDYRPGLLLAGAFWTLAFAVFLACYASILRRPRADGRAG